MALRNLLEIALQIAASSPLYVRSEEVPEAEIEKAVREGWTIILDHDAIGNSGRVEKDERGRVIFRDIQS